MKLAEELPAAVAGTGGLDVVVTSVASDSHTWNLVYLQLLCEQMGHRVHNLGGCVPDDLLVSECARLRPALIVISSVNGHGFADGLRAIRRIRAIRELATTPVVIGGKLGITGAIGRGQVDELRAAGFDSVFTDDHAVASFESFVRQLSVSVRK